MGPSPRRLRPYIVAAAQQRARRPDRPAGRMCLLSLPKTKKTKKWEISRWMQHKHPRCSAVCEQGCRFRGFGHVPHPSHFPQAPGPSLPPDSSSSFTGTSSTPRRRPRAPPLLSPLPSPLRPSGAPGRALEALVGRRPLARYLRRPDRRPPAHGRDRPTARGPHYPQIHICALTLQWAKTFPRFSNLRSSPDRKRPPAPPLPAPLPGPMPPPGIPRSAMHRGPTRDPTPPRCAVVPDNGFAQKINPQSIVLDQRTLNTLSIKPHAVSQSTPSVQGCTRCADFPYYPRIVADTREFFIAIHN